MRQALEIALEALEVNLGNWRAKTKAITAIKEALAQPERDYERGFIDGMQKQMQSSVDRAVNAISQRTWIGLTEEEIDQLLTNAGFTRSDLLMVGACVDQIIDLVANKLKEKNA